MRSRIYVVKRDTVVEAINHLEEFKEKMEKWISKHPEDKYEASLNQVKDGYEIIVNVNKDE